MNPASLNDTPAWTEADIRYMRRALALAVRARGRVEPNPMVGAVIVRDGRVLGEGWHRRYGQAHAEVNALADARKRGHDPAGATMYVTLEPCSHHGKTPPCAQAVLKAKVGRVVCAMMDPFPQVAGRGVAMLREQGVTVDVGLLEADARELNHVFLKRVAADLPWVTLKWAQSIDGRIAAGSGDSQWISGQTARQMVHRWRGRSDAIMVGIGTALADNPRLTARGLPPSQRCRVARRVVVDPYLKLPADSRLWDKQDDGSFVPLLLAVRQETLTRQAGLAAMYRDRGAELLGLPVVAPVAGNADKDADRTPMDLRPLFDHLARVHQASRVLVEGGGRLHGTLIGQNLVDELRVFISPKVIGDDRAPAGVAGMDCPTMAQAVGMKLHDSRRVGEDVLITWRRG